jgi:hypothetical protein
MAIASIGTGSTTVNAGNNQANLVHTVATNSLSAGQLGVFSIASDNASAADSFVAQGGTGVFVTTVTDSVGNNWLRAGEFENAQGSAQAGAVCSMWYTTAKKTLVAASGTITATFLAGSSASFDASASALWIFSVAPGNTVTLLACTGLAADATTACGVMDQATITGNNLRIRAVASETTATTALTTTAGWTAIGVARVSATKLMGIRGEWVITASSTAASACGLNVATIDHASVYAVFQESEQIMGQIVL